VNVSQHSGAAGGLGVHSELHGGGGGALAWLGSAN